MIVGPGDLGFAGGIYNPGAVNRPDGGVTLLAKGQMCHWWDAVGTKADLYYKGRPVLLELDADLKLRGSRVIRDMDGFPDSNSLGYEDFRLFSARGELWTNHNMVELVPRHRSAWTYGEVKPCISALDSNMSRLTFLGHPQLDLAVNRVEKNWVYFEHLGEVYMLYSFVPFRLLRMTERHRLRFSTVAQLELTGAWNDIGRWHTPMSLSTNPIEYDETSLLLVIHQVERRGIERYYHHWGVLIGKRDLEPAKLTGMPLFSGMGARGRRPGIVYVSGVVRRGADFHFFMGEGDAYVTRSSIPNAQLDSMWVEPGR